MAMPNFLCARHFWHTNELTLALKTPARSDGIPSLETSKTRGVKTEGEIKSEEQVRGNIQGY